MHNRAVVSALLGVILAGSAPSTSAWAKKKPVKTAALDPSGCPDFSQRQSDGKDRGLWFRLENRCAQPIRCAVSWELSCPGGSGGGKQNESVDLDGGAAQSVEASAAACGDGSWRVSAAEWKCRFKTAESDTASR